MRSKAIFRLILTAVLFLTMTAPLPSSAGNISWPQDTDLVLTGSGISLKILAGSQADTLDVAASVFTVSVASGESFTVRYPGPDPGTLANDGGIPSCALVGGHNEATVSGPATVSFTPTTVTCTSGGGGGGGGNPPPSVSVFTPNGGEMLSSGALMTMLWTMNGAAVRSARVSLSTDGGVTYPLQLFSGLSTGSFLWTVSGSTTLAKVRVEALGDGGVIMASDASDRTFIILGPPAAPASEPVPSAPPASIPPPAVGYDVAEALAASPTINVDKALVLPPFGTPVSCVSGALIKLPDDGNTATQSDSAVYYCGADGKRYVFPDAGTYHSWYQDFSGVSVISASELADAPLGGNVTYRPGKFMIKVRSDPKVYAVAKGGILRWVTDESVALSLYGPSWNGLVKDISDAFFADYRLGGPIFASDVTSPFIEAPAATAGEPGACVTATMFTAYLIRGSDDPEVRPLQALLECLGFFPSDVEQTGHFGPTTEEAVKRFQTTNGIEAIGYVGPATREALNRYAPGG